MVKNKFVKKGDHKSTSLLYVVVNDMCQYHQKNGTKLIGVIICQMPTAKKTKQVALVIHGGSVLKTSSEYQNHGY